MGEFQKAQSQEQRLTIPLPSGYGFQQVATPDKLFLDQDAPIFRNADASSLLMGHILGLNKKPD